MSDCGMLQAQGQNAMQFKCVQMSLDDSQTSQLTNSRAMTLMSLFRLAYAGVI